MRYVAAYLLAGLGGNANPSAADIEKILSSVGIEVDKDKLKKVTIVVVSDLSLCMTGELSYCWDIIAICFVAWKLWMVLDCVRV